MKEFLISSGYKWWQVKVFTSKGDLPAVGWSLSNYDSASRWAGKAWVHLHSKDITGHSGLRDSIGIKGTFSVNLGLLGRKEYYGTVEEIMLKDWRLESGEKTSPDIKGNGSDGPIIIGTNDMLSINITLDPGGSSGEDADWWILAETPLGWYYYDPKGGYWLPGLSFAYQGPLSDLSGVEILNISGLPPGTYTFYFGVDMNMNGSLDLEQLSYDSVGVNIKRR